ncbi:MAG: alpha-ribazole phosphatase [Firmicutes bacterium]|nr:alpha-ribazole phosphatase [Bacillota bacterium]
MSTRIYLVRHGETEWNALKKFQGHSDISLSDVGRLQATRLANHMVKYKIDAAYASDLSRARETAEIIAEKFDIPVVCKKQLREINFGCWEGLTISEIKANYHGIVTKWWEDPAGTQIPDGEIFTDLVKRVILSLEEIICKHSGQDVMVVSHGGVVRSIICHVLGINLKEYWRLQLNNCSLNIIDFPDSQLKNGILELFNCSYDNL